MNIFTPRCDTQRRPVMVWIFGGGFANGDAADPLFDGQHLASVHDLVVVTVNYRLGPFGFTCYGDSNLGLRDQIAALTWVSNSIAHFGGDPQNVTLFGESAGAMSICSLLVSPAARGLFHRAIAQSGGADHVATADEAALVRKTLEQRTDLDADPVQLMQAARATSAELYPRLRQMAFKPWVDGDVIPFDPEAHGAAGADVPLLIGFNRDEQRLYMSPLRRVSDAELLAFASRRTSAPHRVIDFYRNSLTSHNINAAIMAAIETELRYRQPVLRYARSRGANTWMYRFNWRSPALRGWLGACHALEIPVVFGTTDIDGATRKFVGDIQDLDRVIEDIQQLWVHFARHGRPPAWWPQAPRTMEIHPGVFLAASDPGDAMWDELIPA